MKSFGSSTRLQLPSNTRWSSKWKLVNSVKKNEGCLKSAIWDQSIIDKTNSAPNFKPDPNFKQQVEILRKILCQSPDFWKQLDFVEKILAPLAHAILKIERAVVNVCDSYKIVDAAFGKSLLISDEF